MDGAIDKMDRSAVQTPFARSANLMFWTFLSFVNSLSAFNGYGLEERFAVWVICHGHEGLIEIDDLDGN